MSVQTSVNSRIGNATPGLLADVNVARIISAALESAACGFGIVVSKGTSQEQVVVGGDANDIVGITVRSVGLEQAAIGDTTVGYTQNDAMAILDDGFIFATCANGCSRGDAVKFTNATGVLGGGAPGVGETGITGSEWLEDVAAGQVGKLKLLKAGLVAGS